MGQFLVPSLNTSNPDASTANASANEPKESHLAKFDDKPFRSRCKMDGCKSFTHLYCVKCSTETNQFHLCITRKRNCFYDYHS